MADVYKIGIEIALAGTIMQGLEAIAAKLTGIHTKVKDIEGGFARWGLAIGGAGAIMAGEKIAAGMEKAIKAGGELVKQQALLRNMGVSQADVLATTAAAQKATTEVINTNIAENVKGMRELMGIMPNIHEAQMAYVPLMQAATVLQSLTGAKAEDNMQVLGKAIELRGGGTNPVTHELDPERFKRETLAAEKAIIASGGLVNARALLNMMQQAGPSARAVEDVDKFYKGIITAMMDMGGFRAGTALTAVGRQLLGGKMTKPTAEEMENLGLLIPGRWHKSGTGVFVDKGGLTGEDELKDPTKGITAWMNDVLLPAFASHGITKGADVQQELYRVFGVETARRLAGLFIQNTGQIKRDAALYDNANPDSYKNIAGADFESNMGNISQSFTSLMQAFGSPLVEPAIKVMQSLAAAINAIAATALANPEQAKLIGQGLIGLAAGLTALGAVALVAAFASFVPGGIVAVGITGLVASLGALAAFNWGSLKSIADIQNMFKNSSILNYDFEPLIKPLEDKINGGAIKNIFGDLGRQISEAGPALMQAMRVVGSNLATAIESIPGQVAGAIGAMASGIASSIGNALKGISGAGQTPGTGKGVGEGGNFFVPGAFHAPGGNKATVHSTVAVNLSGKQIAKVVSTQLASLNTHPRQAPYSDSGTGYVSPDYGFATT